MLKVVRAAVVMVLALVLGASCKKNPTARLEGHWHGIRAAGVTPSTLPSANLFAANMELEFKGDQVSVHRGPEKQSTKFHVQRSDDKTIVIATDQDGPNDLQTFTFTDERTMDWTVQSGQTIQFIRQ
jgi:hypothetical protein